MSINKNFTFTLLNQILVNGLGFVSGVFIARTIGPEGRGVFAIFQADVQLLIFFLGLSLSEGIIYFNGNKILPSDKILGLVILLVSLIFILGLLLMWGLSITNLQRLLLPSDYPFIFFFALRVYLSFLTSIANTILNGFLLTNKLFKYSNLAQLINAITGFLSYGAIFFVYITKGHYGTEEIIGLYVLLGVLNTLFLLLLFRKHVGLKPNFRVTYGNEIKPFLKYNFVIAIAVMVNFFNYRIDIYFLNQYTSISELGAYSLAISLSQLLWIFSNNLVIILMPYLVEATPEEKINLLNKYSRINSSFLIVATVVGIFISGLIIPAVYGAAFQESALLFKILIGGSLFCGLTKIYGTYLGSINYFRYNLYSNLGGALMNICLCYLLVPKFGALGAAIGSTTSYLCMYIITLTLANRSGSGTRHGFQNLIIKKDEALALTQIFRNT